MKTKKNLIIGVFFGPFVLSVCAMSSPPPPPPALSMEAAGRKLAALSRSIPAKPAAAELGYEWENAQLYLRQARFLLTAYAPSDALREYATRELKSAEASIGLLRSGQPPPLVTGPREEGYYSGNDGSVQPFFRYAPKAARKGKKLPLLVILHGYDPAMTTVGWMGFPPGLVAFAEKNGFFMAAPFGRSNTDFQGIGEQDVLTVIEAMKKRYAVDENRIILVGYSMGATGAWTLGAHYPDLFAGLLIVSGRGDYYCWHGVKREELPAYKRRLVDAEFAGSLVQNLQAIPIFCAHGALDDIVPVQEARSIAGAVGKINPNLIYVELESGGHGINDEIIGSKQVRNWLLNRRRPQPLPAAYKAGHPRYERDPAVRARALPCGPVKEAFLSPFIFILAGNPPEEEVRRRFVQAAIDWFRFAKAYPRMAEEKTASPEILRPFNVFLFGEPENSALIRQVLADSPVTVTADAFVVGDRAFPRKGNGLYLVRKSPWNPEKLAVVQCGLRWGEAIPENHKYDFLPDFIVYSSGCDEDGSNTALCAGFFNEQGQIAE